MTNNATQPRYLMKTRTYLIAALILVVLGFTAVNGLLLYLTLPGPLESSEDIIIERRKSTREIATKLAETKVIRYPLLFNFIAKVYGLSGRHLKSGEYAILERATPFQVLRILTSGQSIIHKFTVVEGSCVHEAIVRLKSERLLDGEIEDEVTEGFLMPSTYFFSFGDSKQKLLGQMKRSMSEVLDELTPLLSADSPIKSRIELLTLASIVEKEAYLESEKPRIAAVFLNRLKKGMKLQADPTTIYGITLGQYNLARPLSKADLRGQTLYNTYYITGLPPSPIACPSRSSIEAVVKPAKTKDIFFVVNGMGGHNFSSDLSTHNSNVESYRKLRAGQ